MLTGEFYKLKGSLIELADKFQSIDDNIPSSLIGNICSIKDDIVKDEFKILVVGEFSRGKSTFINAVLREKALPSSLRPTTATINYIRYNNDVKMDVIYEDGSTESIPFDEIKNFVTVSGMESSGNKGKVKEVNIGYPSHVIEDGTMIVDTPGVNDPDEHREEITTNLLPSADAVIFLLALDQPVSRSEKDFLKTKVLGSDSTKIFYVVNKIDTSDDEDEISDTLDHISTELRSVNKAPETTLYPISAKMALNGRINNDLDMVSESNIEEFEKALATYLINERGQQTLLKYISQIMSVFHTAERLFDSENKQLSLGLDKAKERFEKIKVLIKEKVIEGNAILNSAEEYFNALSDDLHYRWIDCAESIMNNLKRDVLANLEKIAENIDSIEDFEKRVTEHYRSILTDNFDRELINLNDKCIEISNKLMKDVVVIEKSLNDFLEDSNIGNLDHETQDNNTLKVKNCESLNIGAEILKSGALTYLGSILLGPIGMIAGLICYFGQFLYADSPKKLAKKYESGVTQFIDDFTSKIVDSLMISINEYRKLLSNNIMDTIHSQGNSLQENQQNIVNELVTLQSNTSTRTAAISISLKNLNTLKDSLNVLYESALRL